MKNQIYVSHITHEDLEVHSALIISCLNLPSVNRQYKAAESYSSSAK